MHRAYRHDVRDADPENCRDDHVRGPRRDGASKCHQSARDEDTDAGNDAANGSALLRCALRGAADDNIALGRLLAGLDAADLAVVAVHDAVPVLVELQGAVVDRRQAREALGQTRHAVHRIDERSAAFCTKEST